MMKFFQSILNGIFGSTGEQSLSGTGIANSSAGQLAITGMNFVLRKPFPDFLDCSVFVEEMPANEINS